MSLERLAAWRARAEAETDDLSGRTPALLIAALSARPMLGAVEAEAETGASRAAVQRNLDTLQSRGLVREVTGRGRFRVSGRRSCDSESVGSPQALPALNGVHMRAGRVAGLGAR